MKFNFKKKLFALIFLLLLFFISINKNVNAFNLKDAFNKPLVDTADQAGYDPDPTTNSTDYIITQIIQTVLSFLGVIFLILIIYAGYLWMMARGNEQQVEKAKSLLTEAIIGLIIVVSAYAISYFVIKKIGDNTLQNQGSTATDTAS